MFAVRCLDQPTESRILVLPRLRVLATVVQTDSVSGLDRLDEWHRSGFSKKSLCTRLIRSDAGRPICERNLL